MSLRRAKQSDLETISALIQHHRALLSPAPSAKTLARHILGGTAIFESSVLILYRRHQTGYRLAGITYPPGSTELQVIVSRYSGKGFGKTILERFCEEMGGPVFLNVLETNTRACGFYEGLGFYLRGRKEWACGWVRYYQRDPEER